MYNQLGALLLNPRMSNNLSLPIQDLLPGLYYLILSDGQRTMIARSFSKY